MRDPFRFSAYGLEADLRRRRKQAFTRTGGWTAGIGRCLIAVSLPDNSYYQLSVYDVIRA